MYTQNTPIHVKLWHRDFWLLAIADMLITVSMYMQFLLLPKWMLETVGLSAVQVAFALGVPVLGIFMFGCFCSYFIQRYRRNNVCVKAVLVMSLCFCLFYYLCRSCGGQHDDVFAGILVMRFVLGAAFGVAHIVLSGTLIIDTCESFLRTEANHSSAWFARFALSIGPALSLVFISFNAFYIAMLVAAILCFLSILCILSVKFPFKAPEDILCKISFDRFFLPQGKWLFLNLSIITTVVGLLLSIEHTLLFYVMVMTGFFLALLSQRFVFVNAELKSEITAGLILIIVALLLNFSDNNNSIRFLYPMLTGCGVGIIGARFLLFFIKLKGHCQRSTTLSTFFLSWEFGLSCGLFLGYCCFYEKKQHLFVFAIVLSCLALIFYLLFVHSWYIKNKNR